MLYLWLGIFITVLADFVFKWSANGSKILFLLGWICSIAATGFWGMALQKISIIQGTTIFLTVNMIFAAIGGILIFKETLTVTQWIGVGLAFISILILLRPEGIIRL